MIVRVERYESASTLQRGSAATIVGLLEKAIATRGVASIVLSGGSTPKAIYELIATGFPDINWSSVNVFWGDERCVPPTHPDSNYRTAREALLNKIVIPEKNIFRVEAELDPKVAAEKYAATVRETFQLTNGEWPRFDIVLLGLGEDGHTASLFPGTTILNETRKPVAEVFVPTFNAHRISMTFPVLNNSANVLFLVSGAGKAGILREVLEGEPDKYPAQHIAPTNGSLRWLVDDAAATTLQSTVFDHHSSSVS